MSFEINIPVRVISGRGVIARNTELFRLGSRAAIVTGRHGARSSGALGDVTAALDASGAQYRIFDSVTANPALCTVHEIGRAAAVWGADFVIGIGGGSAMDAAKGAAAFASNPDIEAIELYDPEKRSVPSLPLILVPTTAGTGSETNPYAVLTLPDGLHKKTFTSVYSWARYAFVDPSYTASMNRETTISTALDAFAHAMESYLSPKSTDLSRMLAVYAAKGIWDVLTEYPDEFSERHRDVLAYSSCAAGAAISITGTGFPHPLGYSITLLYGVPHGSACAVFHGDYIEYNSKNEAGRELISDFASRIGATPKLLAEYLPALASVSLELTDEEIRKCVDLIKGAKNYTNSPYVLSENEMLEIYRSHFYNKKKGC